MGEIMIFAKGKQEQRLKWAFESCKNGAWGVEPDGEDDVVCIRAADFDGQSGRLNDGERTLRAVDTETFDKVALRPGDLVMEKSGGGEKQLVGRTVLFDDTRPSVCSNFLARCRPAAGIDPAYLNYLMLAIYVGRGTYPHIKQSTGIQNLDLGSYLDTRVSIPEWATQQRIARFLDEKTARIDALIEKKQALLERLAEKRQALITQAVTKGLNPDVPMKPSGVDWLGDIPAHWQQNRLRFTVGRIEQGWSPQCESRQAELGEWGVLKVGCVNGEQYDESENKALPENIDPEPQYEIHVGDVLVSRANTKELLGSAAMVDETQGRIMFCDKLYRLEIGARLDRRYIVAFLRSPLARFQYEREATGTSGSMQNIGQDTIKNLRHPLPPLNEQKDIGRWTLDVIKNAKHTEEVVVRSIFTLNEHRSALITAAITGQLPELNG